MLHLPDIELKQTSFRLDGLLLPPADPPDLPVVFVGAQFQPDTEFYSRWFAEIFLFLDQQRWQAPWRAVEGPPPVAHQPLLDSPWVKRIYLEDLIQRADLTPVLQLIQLIIAEPATAVSQAQALLTVRGGPAVDPNWLAWLDLIETIVLYKLPHLSREEILSEDSACS